MFSDNFAGDNKFVSPPPTHIKSLDVIDFQIIVISYRWSRLAKCSIMLGDTVTARQANQKAGSPQDQDLKNLEALERFKEETMNALNNKDYRRVS